METVEAKARNHAEEEDSPYRGYRLSAISYRGYRRMSVCPLRTSSGQLCTIGAQAVRNLSTIFAPSGHHTRALFAPSTRSYCPTAAPCQAIRAPSLDTRDDRARGKESPEVAGRCKKMAQRWPDDAQGWDREGDKLDPHGVWEPSINSRVTCNGGRVRSYRKAAGRSCGQNRCHRRHWSRSQGPGRALRCANRRSFRPPLVRPPGNGYEP